MHVFVGLGNPGAEYTNTRHNIGFRVLDTVAVALSTKFAFQKKINADLAQVKSMGSDEVYLLKPHTFMNRSGESVRSWYEYFGGGKPTPESLQNLFVIFDDLDIPLGKYKISLGKGPKVHNGLLSLYQLLGSANFHHVRVGIENRGEDRYQYPGAQYVLARFSSPETDKLNQVIPQITQELIRRVRIA